jgi:hypothetical protein
MTQNCVTRHMLDEPAITDGFAGAIVAHCVIDGARRQVAAASIYDTRVPPIRFSIPETVPHPDFPELARVLSEFAECVRTTFEQVRLRFA